MKANLGRAVSRFGTKSGVEITFLDPLFESIANALDADAQNISVVFSKETDNLLSDSELCPKIFEYTVKDDGEGFTYKNRKAFSELYTDNKAAMGEKDSVDWQDFVFSSRPSLQAKQGKKRLI